MVNSVSLERLEAVEVSKEGGAVIIAGAAGEESMPSTTEDRLANIEKLDPAFEDVPIVRKRQDNVKLGCVLSNSFGFGGTNASLVLKHVDA